MTTMHINIRKGAVITNRDNPSKKTTLPSSRKVRGAYLDPSRQWYFFEQHHPTSLRITRLKVLASETQIVQPDPTEFY